MQIDSKCILLDYNSDCLVKENIKTPRHCRIPKSSPLLHILSQLIQVHAISYLLKNHFNIILLRRSLCLLCCPVPSVTSAKPCVLLFVLMHVTCSAHVVTLDICHQINICFG